MKRFMVFSGSNWYPGGGSNDFVGDYDTLEVAENSLIAFPELANWDWWEIWDTDTREVICSNGYETILSDRYGID